MAEIKLNVHQLQVIDTEENWIKSDRVLYSGEIGIVKETGYYKVGDGVHKWNELEYPISIFMSAVEIEGQTLKFKNINGDIVETIDIPQPSFEINSNNHLIVTY